MGRLPLPLLVCVLAVTLAALLEVATAPPVDEMAAVLCLPTPKSSEATTCLPPSEPTVPAIVSATTTEPSAVPGAERSIAVRTNDDVAKPKGKKHNYSSASSLSSSSSSSSASSSSSEEDLAYSSSSSEEMYHRLKHLVGQLVADQLAPSPEDECTASTTGAPKVQTASPGPRDPDDPEWDKNSKLGGAHERDKRTSTTEVANAEGDKYYGAEGAEDEDESAGSANKNSAESEPGETEPTVSERDEAVNKLEGVEEESTRVISSAADGDDVGHKTRPGERAWAKKNGEEKVEDEEEEEKEEGNKDDKHANKDSDYAKKDSKENDAEMNDDSKEIEASKEKNDDSKENNETRTSSKENEAYEKKNGSKEIKENSEQQDSEQTEKSNDSIESKDDKDTQEKDSEENEGVSNEQHDDKENSKDSFPDYEQGNDNKENEGASSKENDKKSSSKESDRDGEDNKDDKEENRPQSDESADYDDDYIDGVHPSTKMKSSYEGEDDSFYDENSEKSFSSNSSYADNDGDGYDFTTSTTSTNGTAVPGEESQTAPPVIEINEDIVNEAKTKVTEVFDLLKTLDFNDTQTVMETIDEASEYIKKDILTRFLVNAPQDGS